MEENKSRKFLLDIEGGKITEIPVMGKPMESDFTTNTGWDIGIDWTGYDNEVALYERELAALQNTKPGLERN